MKTNVKKNVDFYEEHPYMISEMEDTCRVYRIKHPDGTWRTYREVILHSNAPTMGSRGGFGGGYCVHGSYGG